MRRLGDTIQHEVGKIRSQIEALQKDVDTRKADDTRQRDRLIKKATEVGDAFLRLEKCGPQLAASLLRHAHATSRESLPGKQPRYLSAEGAAASFTSVVVPITASVHPCHSPR